MVMGVDAETIPLLNHVKCEGNIESWLCTLEESMQVSLKEICQKAKSDIL